MTEKKTTQATTARKKRKNSKTTQAQTAQTKTAQPKKKKINIHDVFFKAAFGLRSIVRAFLEQFTPTDFFKKLDIESLEISNTSYVTEELSPYFADMVWTCRFKNSRHPRQLAFLFEHKSFKPTYPHFQLADYLNNAYKKQAESSRKPLIPIMPIIVYHGQRKWNYEPYESYFGTKKEPIDADIVRFLPKFDYLFINLANFSDDIIKASKFVLLQKTLLALKHYADKNYLKSNVEELWFWHYGSKKTEEMYSFIRFFGIYLSKNLDVTRQELFEIVKKSDKSMKVETMTIIDEFIQEGKELGIEIGQEKGIEIGKEKGIEIGKEIGKEETIIQKNREFTINLLSTGDFDDERIAYLVGVDIEFVLQVKDEMLVQGLSEDLDNFNRDN